MQGRIWRNRPRNENLSCREETGLGKTELRMNPLCGGGEQAQIQCRTQLRQSCQVVYGKPEPFIADRVHFIGIQEKFRVCMVNHSHTRTICTAEGRVFRNQSQSGLHVLPASGLLALSCLSPRSTIITAYFGLCRMLQHLAARKYLQTTIVFRIVSEIISQCMGNPSHSTFSEIFKMRTW